MAQDGNLPVGDSCYRYLGRFDDGGRLPLVGGGVYHYPVVTAVVDESVGVSAHTLRWYESIGQVQVPRGDAGYRSYDTDVIGRIIFVI